MSMAVSMRERLTSTLAKEFAVAASGLGLVLFVILHLLGNMLIYAGPETFNEYTQKLHDMPEVLWTVRVLLVVGFIVHISCAIMLARANRIARGGQNYAVTQYKGNKSPATRWMIYSGLFILAFLLVHLYDFALSDTKGAQAEVEGVALGLYGVAINNFTNPIRVLFYLLGVVAVGMHLSHAISSVLVTSGLLRHEATPKADLAARVIAGIITVGFASIPVYVFIRVWITGVPA